IVFAIGGDPVKFGLVASFNRPGGNVTGISFLSNFLLAKQVEILHETIARSAPIGCLVNPGNPNAASDTKDARAAADLLGHKSLVANASTERDIDAALAALIQQRAGALLIFPDSLFASRRNQLAGLAAGHRLPAIYNSREFAEAGGLM